MIEGKIPAVGMASFEPTGDTSSPELLWLFPPWLG